MDMTLFEDVDGSDLRRDIEFLWRHYRAMDPFWFTHVAERVGGE